MPIAQKLNHMVCCFEKSAKPWSKVERFTLEAMNGQVTEVRCEKLIEGQVKVNVDGTSKASSGQSGAECVLGDKNDRWLSGTIWNVGVCSVLHAELCAVLIRLQLAWDSGHRNIIVETDSQKVC